MSAAKGGGKASSSGGGEMTASAEYAKLQRKFENIHSTYRSLKEAEAAQREEVAVHPLAHQRVDLRDSTGDV